jgi:Asp-tRNA(Asn)/Glu-tRNA(Gln) amidotransferase A subunit family amidase
LALLREAGVVVRRIPALEDIDAIARSNFRLMHGEMARTHAAWFAEFADLYHRRTADAIREGQAVGDDELEHLRPERGALRARLEGLMQAQGVDLWACPAAPGPAPLGIESTGNSAMNLPWTFAGMPAIAVPAGMASNGLPVGLQLVAPAMADERLLAWAARLEPILATRRSSPGSHN